MLNTDLVHFGKAKALTRIGETGYCGRAGKYAGSAVAREAAGA
jgi:hypothetical protein